MANESGAPNLGPYESEAAMADPQNNEEVFLGSFSSILQNNLGRYVICEFLIGTDGLERKEGILYTGGINFITLYQPAEEQYIVCDLYSLKFVTFVDTRSRPRAGVAGELGSYGRINPQTRSVEPVNPSGVSGGAAGQTFYNPGPMGRPRQG